MILVIGGGPAGCMAALTAAKQGVSVRLLEQNEKIGKKWYITGKGRCNLTNKGEMQAHLTHIRRNPKFLQGAFARYSNEDICQFFEAQGVPVKVERGDRVFPSSDKSSDTIRAFERALEQAGVQVSLHTRVRSISKEEKGFNVTTNDKSIRASAVIVATGGLSYPITGATGDGYQWARELGHHVTPLFPSLVGLNLKTPYAHLQGLSLRNVCLKARWGKKKKQWFGEMLFTHFGISGPIVLQMSAEAPVPYQNFSLHLDLKPALRPEILSARIQREADASPLKEMGTIMERLVPGALVPSIVSAAKIDPTTKAAVFTAKDRNRLVTALQSFPLQPAGFRGFNEAIVTRGGVRVQEVDATDMMSKKARGLFFCGEILDLDGDTGGYNMQIAWSTGYAAGMGAVRYCKEGCQI